jgi:glycosyltransferase involved in cell wall biosynthesis
VHARRGAAGPPVRVERDEDLYDTLDGAWLLVTGWSNTVFEAALSGVPSLCVSIPGSQPPVDFAADGIALGGTDEASAAAAARRLLDDGAWRQAVTDARAALADRLGPLDGRASERLADLVLELSRRTTPQD